MSTEIYRRILNDPRYAELVSRRKRLAWLLAGSTLGVFFSFVLIVAFKPSLLAIPVSGAGVTTIAIPLGVAMIVFFWVATGIYVRRASRDFDGLTDQIVQEASK
ncbi:MAG: DUF485 domain-containing protein [Accumulibacter sp.]|jgi:uncharacterized membrane protein (DUF485 family)|uniref:DUF485 domain-containing protein n=1 Tax=Accumulibacter sp. TaxID=2053492 RepID=UPI002FC35CDC